MYVSEIVVPLQGMPCLTVIVEPIDSVHENCSWNGQQIVSTMQYIEMISLARQTNIATTTQLIEYIPSLHLD